MSTTELEAKARELKELKRMKEDMEAEITAAEEAIKAHMDECGIDTLAAGAFKITWKSVTTALKKALPEIAERFSKTTATRRFLVA